VSEVQVLPRKYLLLLIGGLPLIAAGFWAPGLLLEGLCCIALAALLNHERIPLPQYRAPALTIEGSPTEYTALLKRYVFSFYVAGAALVLVALISLEQT
jgi:hypothetical protein